jgi:hypothetical protein
LERLAHNYCARTAPPLHGRIACIKRLLRDALAAYSTRGNPSDADLITTLFFGDPATSRVSSAGELLKLAMKKHGVTDEKKFREERRHALGKFVLWMTRVTQPSTP